MKLTLVRRQKINREIDTFWLKPEKPFTYQAGQYVEVTLKHNSPDERGSKRWFTLSSAPTEPLVSITTRRGDSSFKHALWQFQRGDSLVASEPMGDFVLPKDETIPLVFVVGGIGVTPVRSIVHYLIDSKEKRSLRVLYSVKSKSDIAFRDVLNAYPLALDITTNRFTAKKILDTAAPLRNQLIYLSGPEPMIENLHSDLMKLGVPREQLVMDGFEGYPDHL